MTFWSHVTFASERINAMFSSIYAMRFEMLRTIIVCILCLQQFHGKIGKIPNVLSKHTITN